MKTAEGLYVRSIDVVVSQGAVSSEHIAMILAHELTHGHQAGYKVALEMSQYEKEFQAFVVQSEFLRMLPPGTVPKQWEWLATATLKEIENHVLKAYPTSFKPKDFSNEEACKFILETLRGAAGG
jgi:hypothetical protein